MEVHRYQISYETRFIRKISEKPRKARKVGEDNLYFKGVGILEHFGKTFEECEEDESYWFFQNSAACMQHADKIIKQKIGRWIERKRLSGVYRYLGTIDLLEDLVNKVISAGIKNNEAKEKFRKKAYSLISLLQKYKK